MEGEDEERQREGRGEMGKEGEGREEEKRAEGRVKEGDERTVDTSGDANNHIVTSLSADHWHPTSSE